MSNASTLGSMSPELRKVVERAQREPEGRFQLLAHRLDGPALARAYRRQRQEAGVGVDGVTKEAYGRDLEARLRDLHARLRTKQYLHQPIRRVHIPKGQGKTRPIGIAASEDKLVQDAVREVNRRGHASNGCATISGSSVSSVKWSNSPSKRRTGPLARYHVREVRKVGLVIAYLRIDRIVKAALPGLSEPVDEGLG